MNHIERWLQRAVDEAAAGNTDYCLLLETVGDPDRWIQLTWCNVNAAYPFVDEPMDRLRAADVPMYPWCEVASWEAGKFATFEHAAEPLDQIAAFVAAYFERVLKVSSTEDALRAEEQQL